MNETCTKCKEEGEDRRTLWMACGYDMSELNIFFEKETLYETSDPRDDGIKFFSLRICKNCRADWMRAIQYWWNTNTPKESCGSGIFVRDFGTSKEITLEEYREKYDNEKREI